MNNTREFLKYQHVERFGTDEVEDIEFGTVHIFPKIDGTNGSLWISEGILKAGSRNRELTIDNDNQGFLAGCRGERSKYYLFFLKKYPHLRLFGEWLVPHSLKTYREDAWRKFYVFDVIDERNEKYPHLDFDIYAPMLAEFEIDYIDPIVIVENPNSDMISKAMEKNQYLIQDDKGNGEGIVLKNYNYINKYGRQTWAKVVTNEFKDKHRKEMGALELQTKTMNEEMIIESFLTEGMIKKTFAKIKNDAGKWESKMIPQLLGTVYHDFIIEETWNFIKKLKSPTVDFTRLQKIANNKIKVTLKDLF